MSKSIQLKDINNNKYYPHPYYPVGSVYLSVNNTNPTRWFGGTWELISQGRTLIGVDTNDTDFNTVKKSGGSKTHTHTTGNHTLTVDEIPSHRHDLQVWNKNDNGSLGRWGINDLVWYNSIKGEGKLNYWVGETSSNGGDQPHNHGDTGSSSNLQPYFTCYIWCRTA